MTSELIYCPKCNAQGVMAVRTGGHSEVRRSRGSGQSAATSRFVIPGWVILTGCTACGASKLDITREFR